MLIFVCRSETGRIRGSGKGEKINFVFLIMAKLYQMITNLTNNLYLLLSIVFEKAGLFRHLTL